MTDEDFAKIISHGEIEMLGPATVDLLVARGARRAGLARLVSALQHRMFDEGAAEAAIHSPRPEVQIFEEHKISRH